MKTKIKFFIFLFQNKIEFKINTFERFSLLYFEFDPYFASIH